jgi:hypothetical protein
MIKHIFQFQSFKISLIKTKKYEKNFFCILKVTEDIGKVPHPDPLVRGTDPRIRIRIRTKKVTDPEH